MKPEKAKAEYLQIRVSEGQKEFAKGLAEDYGIDVSKLVLFALDYVNRQRPQFVIESQGKSVAQLAEVKSVQAHCVASVIIPAGKMPEFIGIMQTNLEKFRQARMDEENEYFNFDAANPDQGADS